VALYLLKKFFTCISTKRTSQSHFVKFVHGYRFVCDQTLFTFQERFIKSAKDAFFLTNHAF
jgi:hypothetical protein